MQLTKGARYKKSDFGIKFPRTFLGVHEVNGVKHYFINIGGKYNNQRNNAGIILEPRNQWEVVQGKRTVTETIHCFLRDQARNESDFEYIGVLATEENYDTKRNLLTFK